MYFRSDIKKICTNKFVVILFLGLLVAFVGCAFNRSIFYLRYPTGKPIEGTNPYEIWMIADSTNWGFFLLHALFWVFPVLFSGFIYVLEKTSSMRKFLIVRGSRNRYYASKICVAAILPFVIFIILLGANTIASWLVYQPSAPYSLDYMLPKEGSLAECLFSINPLLMVTFYIVYISLCQSVLSLLVLGVWAVFNFPSRYVAVIVPTVVLYIIGRQYALIVTERFSLSILIQPLVSAFYEPPIKGIEFLLALAPWLVIAIILLTIGWFRNKDIM